MLWEKIKNHLTTSIGVYTFLFVVVSLVAWYMNATKGTKFDLNQLRDIYLFVAGQLSIKYIADSKWNSPDGKPPHNYKHPDNG